MGFSPGAPRLEGPLSSKKIFFISTEGWVGGGGATYIMKGPKIILAQGHLKA